MKQSQVFMLAVVVLALVLVALIAGVEQTPVTDNQPGQQDAASTDSTARSFGTSLETAALTAALTTALGFIAFVVGQLALKLIVDPIQEQRRAVGRVTHALTYYGNVSPESPTGPDSDRTAEARKVYRDLAAELRTNLRVIPSYRVCSRLRLVLPEERVRWASTALIGLSNTVRKGPGAEDVSRFRRDVEQNLGIEH